MHEQATIAPFNVMDLRKQFPILDTVIHGNKPLTYLDNAATTQKPLVVIDAIDSYYRHQNSNVHRGAHTLSAQATNAYEAARQGVADFLHADRAEEVVFTRGTTESINLVATAWGSKNVKEGDEILVTDMEHHANIVPWQMLCERVGATLKHVPVLDDGSLDLESYERMITPRTVLAAFTHASNTTGTVNPVKEMCRIARERGVTTLIDGAQAVLHGTVDVQDIDCDFYAFSAHKLFGPTGIGVLYGRYNVLINMPPYQGGGSMIHHVSFAKTTYNDVPVRFEAGTPHIAGAIGLHAAIDWFTGLDVRGLEEHEHALLTTATDGLLQIDGLRIIGTTPGKIPVISFTMHGIHGHDIGMLLDEQGVAVRTGHHCTMPLMERFSVGSTTRASFSVYNTIEEASFLVTAVQKAARMLR